MSSPAQSIANAINARSSTGPRTEEGKTTSSKNATTHGLFTDHDFIRPAEQSAYADLDKALNHDLAPQGMLEHELVNEIRRAMWRLRRCGLVEASMVPTDHETGDDTGNIPDPMQVESQAKLQISVDRARSQAHRLMHKCTAELRKLQTDRLYRNESTEDGTDLSYMGICDWRSIEKQLTQQSAAEFRLEGLRETLRIDAMLAAPLPSSSESASFCKTPRDAKNAAPMQHAA